MYCFIVVFVCGILVGIIVYLGNFAKGRDVMNVGVALGNENAYECKLTIIGWVKSQI